MVRRDGGSLGGAAALVLDGRGGGAGPGVGADAEGQGDLELAVDRHEDGDQEGALELDGRLGSADALEAHGHGARLLDSGAEVVHLELDLLDGLGDPADLAGPRDGLEADEVADVGLDVEGDLGEGQALTADVLALLEAGEQGLRGGEEVGAVDRGEVVELGDEVADLVLGRDDDDGRLVALDAHAHRDRVEVGGGVGVAVEGLEGGLGARDLPLGGELEDARHAVLVLAQRLELDREALDREEAVDLVGVASEDALEGQRAGEGAEGGQGVDEPALLGCGGGLAPLVPLGHEVEVVLAELDAAGHGGEASGAVRDGGAAVEGVAGAEDRERQRRVVGGDVAHPHVLGGVEDDVGIRAGHGGLGGEVGDGVGRAHG